MDRHRPAMPRTPWLALPRPPGLALLALLSSVGPSQASGFTGEWSPSG